MSEKIRDESSHVVTSNKHLEITAGHGESENLQGYKGGAASWEILPGSGRPDGPADDGSSGGPTTGGAWGGMQFEGASDTSTDEMAVVEEFSRHNPSAGMM